MNDQDYWRQEQARADAARIKRAQGRDGTWVSLRGIVLAWSRIYSQMLKY